MRTTIISIHDRNTPDLSQYLESCADALKAWSLVAFPTETVYWLWANALLESSVRKIFEVKQRPADNPLIVHIADVAQLPLLTSSIPDHAMKLINAFWPWPLTILLPKSPIIPSVVTCGLDDVAVRCPAHPIAREFLRLSGVPVAAPSANISWKPSPTRAEHVSTDLLGKIPYIIDAWHCDIWIESTVLWFDHGLPIIYRHGAITVSMIESVLGVSLMSKTQVSTQEKPMAPWMKYRHYSPSIPVYVIEHNYWHEIQQLSQDNDKKICLLSYESPEAMAAFLFHDFREADLAWYTAIYVQSVPEIWLWKWVMERLRKAASVL